MMQQAGASTVTCQDVLERVELYLDKALPPAEIRALHAHLRVCASCRAELGAAKAVEARLREAFRDETPPNHLWSLIAADLRVDNSRAGECPSARLPSRRAMVAAGALLTMGAVLAGRWLTRTGINAAELLRTPVDELRSFIDSGRPVDIASTAPEELREWFVVRVDFPPPTPPTMSYFSLFGGRLCYFFERRIAAYMYSGEGHVLSLYVMSDRGIESPPRGNVMLGGRPAAAQEFDGFAHVLWRNGKLFYSLVSNQRVARLVQVARTIAIG